MKHAIREVSVRTVLSKSGIPGADYCLNPYVGCEHACRYCYATFMKKYTGHEEPWGNFVDVKMNAREVLQRQLKQARRGSIIISSVTDPYQPIEERYRLTRRCLEMLIPTQFPISILTKSPLVLRDLDLIRRFEDIEVGLSVTTDDERMRQVFEPGAPPIDQRIEALRTLRVEGVKNYAFIGPLLPMDPETLAEKLRDIVTYTFIDRMNYVPKTLAIYQRLGMTEWLDKAFVRGAIDRLRKGLSVKQCIRR